MEYRPWNFLYVRARFGITKSTTDDETFRSPEDTKFDDSVESLKGSYTDMRRESLSYEGDFTITYGQLLADVHQINAVFGASCSESNSDYKSFSAAGFPEGNFTKPSLRVVMLPTENLLIPILRKEQQISILTGDILTITVICWT